MSDLQTLGFAAATFQRDPRTIEAGIRAVQVERAGEAGKPIPHNAQPAMVLNGKRYFLSDEIIAAVTWLAKNEAEKLQEEISNEQAQ